MLQGLNDLPVTASEGEQILAAIRKAGGNACYMLAKDEGHSFRKKANRGVYMASIMLFLETFLLSSGATTSPQDQNQKRRMKSVSQAWKLE